MKLYIDFETLSECDIKKAGGDAYARHHTTSPICMAFALGDAPVQVYVPLFEAKRAMRIDGSNYPIVHELPQDVQAHVGNGGAVVAQNAVFDFNVWMHHCKTWPQIKPSQLDCTMARACAMALPSGLDAMGEALGISMPKDKMGTRLINKMCRPPFETSPILLGQMINYCARDVEAMREIDGLLLPLHPVERDVWLVNFRANQKGIALDQALISECLRLSAEEDINLAKMAHDVAGLDISAIRSPLQLKKWAETQGVDLPDLSKDTMATFTIENPLVQQVLDIREQVCKTSIKKFNAMLEVLCDDGRARGNHIYHKATTGRFAGSGVQVQNIPRPSIDDCDTVSDHVITHGALPSDIKCDTKTALSSLLRSCIVAPELKEFYCADYSAIESRVLFWLADEQKGLDVYRNGDDLYCVTASSIFGRPVTKADKYERSVGKVAVLSLGYQGGVKAFTGMCDALGVDLKGVDPQSVVNAYRDTYSKVKIFWADCGNAAIEAIKQPGVAMTVGKCKFKYSTKIKALGCRLPSGRIIQWPQAELDENAVTPWGAKTTQVTYKGMNLAHKWTTKRTYSGDVCQSAVQAVARDMLCNAMIYLDRAGFPIVLHVHDEIMAEMPVGAGRFKEFERIMSTPATWAQDCPIAVEGWVGTRYQK